MSMWGDQHDTDLNNLVCLGVDGKDDKNVLQFKNVIENGKTLLLRVTEKEHHLTFTYESRFEKGSYLLANGATGLLQSELVYDVLKGYDSLNSVQAYMHDNARPHTAKSTCLKLIEMGWEILPHPPYSPDISPCNYHFFRAL